MATVTGLTAARMEAIEAASVVDGDVVGDNLILTKHDASTINAGNVRGPTGSTGATGPTGPASIGLMAWPVGSIFMAVVSTNPNTLLGGGTWAAWGTGRVPVAIDTGQTEFDTVEETGGSKTVTLTAAQIPAHTHLVGTGTSGATSTQGLRAGTVGNSGAGVISNSFASDAGTGGGGSHSNLQPYITCYMWKRTA